MGGWRLGSPLEELVAPWSDNDIGKALRRQHSQRNGIQGGRVGGWGPYGSEEDSPISQQAAGKVCGHHTPLMLLSRTPASLLAREPQTVPCQHLSVCRAGKRGTVTWSKF